MPKNTIDPVSPELRAIEKEIDNYYKKNPLINLPFGISIWHLLAYYEDKSLFSKLKLPNATMHEIAAIADNFVVELQYPLYWLWKECPKGGKVPVTYEEYLYSASHELAELASNYMDFAIAFTYASNHSVNLELQGNTITPVQKISTDFRYEAYCWLVKQQALLPEIRQGDLIPFIERSLVVSEYEFEYRLGHRLIEYVIKRLGKVFSTEFELPDDWRFPNYSLEEFRRMAKVLMAISIIHSIARFLAASKGCKGLGLNNSLIVTTKSELSWKLGRYSNVKPDVSNHFIEDMTYGNRGIRHPDPALQPLIQANETQYIIMPSLFIACSTERNLLVLFNRLPTEKDVYSRLVQKKEELMRSNIQHELSIPGIRYSYGKIEAMPDLPDVDLAIISDQEKIVLITELKWIIEPSEPREVIEKSEDLIKGVSQMLKLKQVMKQNPFSFYPLLGIDESYKVYFLVLSENFIGSDKSQHPNIPILNMQHFIKKLNQVGNLKISIDWLMSREYLPVEDKDYKVVDIISRIGDWSMRWYGLRPLRENEFI